MDQYYAIIVSNKFYDIWNGKTTDNYITARLYDSLEDLKEDAQSLKSYRIKKLIIDSELNLISERFI